MSYISIWGERIFSVEFKNTSSTTSHVLHAHHRKLYFLRWLTSLQHNQLTFHSLFVLKLTSYLKHFGLY